MNFFERIPLKNKFLLIAIVPLSALLFFAIQIVSSEEEKLQIFKIIKEKARGITFVAELASELQEERAASFQYLIHQGQSGRNQMIIQRNNTDDAIKQLKLNLENDYPAISQSAFINLLAEKRFSIDSLAIGYDECLDFYAQSMLKLYEWVPRIDGQIKHPSLIAKLKAQLYLGQAASYLALIRSKYYNGLKLGLLDHNEFGKLRNYYASYNAAINQYVSVIDKERLNELRENFASDTISNTLNAIETSIRNGRINKEISKEQWISTASAAVEILYRIRDEDLLLLQAEVDRTYQEKLFNKWLAIALVTFVFVFTVLLLVFNISALVRVITRIEEKVMKLSMGNTEAGLKVLSKDVLGSLAESIKKVASVQREVADAAKAIGNGDFSVNIEPKSKQDILASSINQMRDNLRKFTEEKNQDLWMNEGLIGVSASVRGEKNIQGLTRNALNFLSEFLFAEVGVFYIIDEKNRLCVSATYSCDPTEVENRVLKPGEGIPGQAFVTGKPILVDKVPEGYLTIKSATGKSTPRSIVVFPMKHEEKVCGVLELASFRKFSEQDMILLERVAKPVAIAIEAASSRLKLEELLEETQAQAEELQAQQEELQTINYELELQAQRLSQSDEELRAQQEELMQANNLLEDRASELEEKNKEIVEKNQNLEKFTKEIEKKNEELQVASKYKSEFLANMSHELRTPLNSILLLSKLMDDQSENTAPSGEFREYAQVIHNSGKGLLELINDILDLSKIEAGKMEFEAESTSVCGLMDEIKAMFGPVAQQKHIDFSIEYGQGIPETIITDKLRVVQVLRNLLSNAIKFTEKGSVKLFIDKNEAVLPGHEECLVFTVTDTGIGIAEDKQSLVFEAFQQIDGSSNRKYSGTGLGLSISREIAKHLGGSISLQSKEGQGSSFTFTLPVSPLKISCPNDHDEGVKKDIDISLQKGKYTVDTIPGPVVDDRNKISATDRRILIIEDDVEFAKELLSISRKKGYKGIVAVRGDEGVRLAEEFRPSGIILDLKLPVMDGFSVLDKLKESAATRHIPVHVVSSLDKNKILLSKGAVDFTQKPVNPKNLEEIFSKIEMAIGPGKRKVLIIEPDQKHAKAFSDYLKNLKIETVLAESIEQGEQKLKEGVGCVVVDVYSGGKSSITALEGIKMKDTFQDLPLVLYTGKGLSLDDEHEIVKRSKNLVYKTADSFQRLLDEVSLFLHVVRDEGINTAGPKKPYLQSGALKGKKVLVADDDVRNVFSLTKVLELNQMKVVTAGDGLEALKMLKENPDTDIVLMDMMMPEMDGYETIRAIRKNSRYHELPIISVTAKAMKGDREKCIKAGASDYVSKPVDAEQLLSLMRVWLYH